MGRNRFKSAVILAAGITFLQVAYVNCSSPANYEFSQAKSEMGGGDGYSGKLYVMVNDGGLCSDGNPYRSRIEMQYDKAYLVRENCAAVTPKLVDVIVSSVDSNVLAYDLKVFRSETALNVVPQAPTVLAALGMTSSNSTNHPCAGADCWKFEANGSISSQVDFTQTGDHDFTILARADLAQSAGATMELRIDGVVVNTFNVASTVDAEYTVRSTVAAGRHEIAVAYTNDYQDVNEDRNLFAVSVQIASVGQVTSACLRRTTGTALTLASSDLPYLNKTLAPETRVDARGVVYSGTSSNPLRIGGGTDSCLAGGSIAGTWPLSATYSTTSGTWAIGIFGPNFLLENYRVHNYGDCIGIFDNAAGFDVRGAYCTQIRGDLIANKNGWGGTVQDSLLDGGSSFFNDSGAAAAPAGAVSTLRNNLVRLQSYQETYWGTPGHGWFWKQDTTAAAVKLRLHGNVFMAEQAPLGSMTLDPSTIASCKKADGSPDNTIVWLGAGPYPYPSELTTGCFTVTTDRAVWDQAVADWKSRHGY